MPNRESPLNALEAYLPPGSFTRVCDYLKTYKVHLTVTKDRKSILGNYRHKLYDKTHRISVNGNLNKYSFLVTLLHELAHMLAFEKFGHTIQPHGMEWKREFGQILAEFIPYNIFPVEIEKILLSELNSPAASTCADANLTRALRKYDTKVEGLILVEDLPEGSNFRIKGGRLFKKGVKLRTRYKCTEIDSSRVYLFSGVHEVIIS